MSDPITAEFLAWRRRRDPGRLARVFDVAAPDLLQLALHLVGNAATAEDLVQQTFLAAIEAPERFDGERQVGAWLAGILANRARRVHRERGRELDPERLERALSSEDPSEALADRELSAALLRALDGLPEPYREPALMRFRHGLEPAEIAHTLRRSPGTVRSQLHRAAALLRQAVPAGALPAWLIAIDTDACLERLREAVLERAASITVSSGALGAGVAIVGLKSWSALAMVGLALAMLVGWGLVPSDWSMSGRADVQPAEGATAGLSAPLPAAGPRSALDSDSLRVAVDPARATVETPATADLQLALGLLEVVVTRGGEPAPGHWFAVTPEVDDANFESWTATTGSDGRAWSGEVDEGWYSVEFAGGETRRVRVEREGTAVASLDLGGARSVRGRVVTDDGDPISGATVMGRSDAGYQLPLATSDDLGEFEYHGAGADTWLHAERSGFLPTKLVQVWFSGRHAQDVELTMAAGGVGVTVTTVDASGQPVVGARVELAPVLETVTHQARAGQLMSSERPDALGITDGRGQATFASRSVGSYRLVARARATAVHEQELEVRGATDLTVVLEPGVRVRGRVVDADGAPVVGAELQGFGSFGFGMRFGVRPRVESGPDGAFELSGVRPESVLSLNARVGGLFGPRGFEAVHVGTEDVDQVAVTIDGHLLRVSGSLTDHTGEPLAHWPVRLTPVGVHDSGGARAYTDADGTFAFETYAVEPWTLGAYAPGAEGIGPVAERAGVTADDSPVSLVVDATDAPNAELVVTVLDERGFPVTDAAVVVRPQREGVGSATLELWRAGQSTGLVALPSGTVSITAHSTMRGTAVRQDVVLGANERRAVEIQLEQPGGLTFDWEPRDDAWSMALLHEAATGARTEAWRGAAGDWQVTALQPGRYTLELREPGIAWTSDEFEVESSSVVDLGAVEIPADQ